MTLAAGGVQPEQHRIGGPAVAGELLVGVEFGDEPVEVLAAGVVLEEQADGGAVVRPACW
jgi:hypothetical protein